MARAGRFELKVDFSKVERNLEASVRRVQRGTKKATKAACEEIQDMSLKEVPRKTNALASSFFYEIHGSYKNFTATIGYGGKGDPVNPITGKRVSEYMVAVHEDLEARHTVGKAKFLEDPIKRYQSQFIPTFAKHIKGEL